MSDTNEKLTALTEAASQMIDAVADAQSAKIPKKKVKSYSYKTTNKNGVEKIKTINRTYNSTKETELTLQNKEHKTKTIENIKANYDKIMELPERKRISYIRSTCLPPYVTSSYNTVKSIWNKILTEGVNPMSEAQPK